MRKMSPLMYEFPHLVSGDIICNKLKVLNFLSCKGRGISFKFFVRNGANLAYFFT